MSRPSALRVPAADLQPGDRVAVEPWPRSHPMRWQTVESIAPCWDVETVEVRTSRDRLPHVWAMHRLVETEVVA